MSKTKEEIYDEIFNPKKKRFSYPKNRDRIYAAMSEYAKQEAIEFAEWISGEEWENYDGYDRWILWKNYKNVASTSQLYQLFITSKTK